MTLRTLGKAAVAVTLLLLALILSSVPSEEEQGFRPMDNVGATIPGGRAELEMSVCTRAGGAWDYRKGHEGRWGAYCDVNGHAVLYQSSEQFARDVVLAARSSNQDNDTAEEHLR